MPWPATPELFLNCSGVANLKRSLTYKKHRSMLTDTQNLTLNVTTVVNDSLHFMVSYDTVTGCYSGRMLRGKTAHLLARKRCFIAALLQLETDKAAWATQC